MWLAHITVFIYACIQVHKMRVPMNDRKKEKSNTNEKTYEIQEKIAKNATASISQMMAYENGNRNENENEIDG